MMSQARHIFYLLHRELPQLYVTGDPGRGGDGGHLPD